MYYIRRSVEEKGGTGIQGSARNNLSGSVICYLKSAGSVSRTSFLNATTKASLYPFCRHMV